MFLTISTTELHTLHLSLSPGTKWHIQQFYWQKMWICGTTVEKCFYEYFYVFVVTLGLYWNPLFLNKASSYKLFRASYSSKCLKKSFQSVANYLILTVFHHLRFFFALLYWILLPYALWWWFMNTPVHTIIVLITQPVWTSKGGVIKRLKKKKEREIEKDEFL